MRLFSTNFWSTFGSVFGGSQNHSLLQGNGKFVWGSSRSTEQSEFATKQGQNPGNEILPQFRKRNCRIELTTEPNDILYKAFRVLVFGLLSNGARGAGRGSSVFRDQILEQVRRFHFEQAVLFVEAVDGGRWHTSMKESHLIAFGHFEKSTMFGVISEPGINVISLTEGRNIGIVMAVITSDFRTNFGRILSNGSSRIFVPGPSYQFPCPGSGIEFGFVAEFRPIRGGGFRFPCSRKH